jgi:hypothetical protein
MKRCYTSELELSGPYSHFLQMAAQQGKVITTAFREVYSVFLKSYTIILNREGT